MDANAMPAETPTEPTPKPLFEVLDKHRQSQVLTSPSWIDLRFDEYQLDALRDFVAHGLDAARTEYTNRLAIAARPNAEPIEAWLVELSRRSVDRFKQVIEQLDAALELIS